jgi:predicted dehydrogenase
VTEVRVGVIGVNGIGVAHLFAIGAAERTTVTAVCDIDPVRAEKAAADFGVPAFTDPDAMYRADAVDAVVVATPAGTHGELVRGALDAGRHVYCEKPIAPTCDEGYALARRAHDAHRVLVVGFQHRFNPRHDVLRAAVAEIGPLTRVQLTGTNWFRSQHYFESSPWRATWRMAGGGVLMNQAIHQLDALISIAGLPSTVRARVGRTRHRSEVEDDAISLLEWESGATGTVVASLNDPAGTERFELYGERGAIVAAAGETPRRANYAPVQETVDNSTDDEPGLVSEWDAIELDHKPNEFKMFIAAHGDFAAAVLDGATPRVDGAAGTQAVELANAIYLSSLSSETIELPLERGLYPPVYDELVTGARSI